MTSREIVLSTMVRIGRTEAETLQSNSSGMSGTEMYRQEDYIPDFIAAVQTDNMLNRKAGMTDGFLCRSSAGRIVRLIQNYDSSVYTQEPEELPAQWGFYWSSDPLKALPFIALSTSPYNTGDCCTYEGHVWRSGQDNNIWAPGTINVQWEDLGTVDEVMNGVIQEPDNETPDALGPDGQGYPVWSQPAGAHDAYNAGDIVDYGGTLYVSLIDGNVWPPDAYPAGWQIYAGNE